MLGQIWDLKKKTLILSTQETFTIFLMEKKLAARQQRSKGRVKGR